MIHSSSHYPDIKRMSFQQMLFFLFTFSTAGRCYEKPLLQQHHTQVLWAFNFVSTSWAHSSSYIKVNSEGYLLSFPSLDDKSDKVRALGFNNISRYSWTPNGRGKLHPVAECIFS